MTTVTVTVDATWRIARFECVGPTTGGNIYGYSEVLLEQPNPPADGTLQTVGTMVGQTILRAVNDVKDQSVTVDGTTLTFTTVLEAMAAFFEKWKVEDDNKPEAGPIVKVPGVPLTPLPQLGDKPPMYDELPSPVLP